jgi:hypothetical protein
MVTPKGMGSVEVRGGGCRCIERRRGIVSEDLEGVQVQRRGVERFGGMFVRHTRSMRLRDF